MTKAFLLVGRLRSIRSSRPPHGYRPLVIFDNPRAYNHSGCGSIRSPLGGYLYT